jgi:hypothetical protein
MVELGELTREEAQKIAEYVERDIEDAGQLHRRYRRGFAQLVALRSGIDRTTHARSLHQRR